MLSHLRLPGLRRLCLLTGFALVALLAGAQVASAATATVSAGKLTFTGDIGEQNAVDASQSGAGAIEIIDNDASSIDISGAAGCSVPDSSAPYIIDCTGITSIQADLTDGNDRWDGSGITDIPQTLNGGDGSDNLTGGGANDTLDGGTGDDTLDGMGGADHLTGDAGADELDDTTASDGTDVLDGGDDNDYFWMGSAANGLDTITGGTGVNELDYADRSAGVTVDLGAGTGGQTGTASDADTLSGIADVFGSSAAGNTITGDANPNDLEGGDGIDHINGAGGDDFLYGGGANDVLSGGDGNDSINGGGGQDTINGDNNNDTLSGGDGGDTINGGAGDDYIYPGSAFATNNIVSDGSDTIDGGDGTDSIDYSDRNGSVTADLRGTTASPTTANGESGENDSIANVENVTTGSGADNITGNEGPNMIDDGGGAGDTIHALGGNDNLFTLDNAVDTADCGDGSDTIEADVAGQFNETVSDNLTGCESVNPDYVAPAPQPTPPVTPAPTQTPVVTPAPVVTPPVVFTAGAFVLKTQQSPKADTVFGSATIPADGSSLEVDLFYNGKLAKLNLVGKLVKKGLKKGPMAFQVKLSKKAAKLAAKKGKKGLPLTVKVTIKPPTGASTVKTLKVVVKKGIAPRCAAVNAHIAC
jgi:Ca2+-binding RTX toxin-like protein